MPALFDPDQYTTVPTRSAAATLGLARGLISAAPSRPPATQALRLARLRERAELLQRTWIEAGRPVEVADLRKLDIILDRRWGALRARLEGCVLLSDGDDLSPRAMMLLRTLFPTGLDFLKLPYTEEWAQSERRLVLIKTDRLEDELAALCGEPFLPLLREAHATYGEALGITKRKEAPTQARVLEPLEELKEAIASYARGVIGTMNEYDPDSVAAAQQQLDPILRARRAVTLGESLPEEPSEPVETPLPALPLDMGH